MGRPVRSAGKTRGWSTTHCWLQVPARPEKLNVDAQGLLRSDEHEAFLSAASARETVIKHALGKLRLPLPPAEYIPDRVAALVAQAQPRPDLRVARPGAGGRRPRKA